MPGRLVELTVFACNSTLLREESSNQLKSKATKHPRDSSGRPKSTGEVQDGEVDPGQSGALGCALVLMSSCWVAGLVRSLVCSWVGPRLNKILG